MISPANLNTTPTMPVHANLSTEEQLLRLNNDVAVTLIPAMLFVAVLMALGLVGNSVVCYVFAARMKPGTQNFMIVCLAAFDLMSCLISMPTEIADMRYYYMFDSEFACKLFRFVNVLSCICSILTLTVIAVDRFVKVCRPLGRQMTLREAKIAVIVSVFVAILFSWPAVFIYGERTAETEIPGISGRDCSTSDDLKDTKYPLIYNCVLFLAFIVLAVAFAVIYTMIYREVKRHKKYMTKVAISTPSSPVLSSLEFNYPSTNSVQSETLADELPIRQVVVDSATSYSNGSYVEPTSSDKKEKTVTFHNGSSSQSEGESATGNPLVALNGFTKSEYPSSATGSPKTRPKPPPLRLTHVNDSCESDLGSGISACSTPKKKSKIKMTLGRETRTTVIAFLVTTVFVLSYLPYLALVFSRIFFKDYDHDLRGASLAAYNLFLRSYFVNSASNPIVYGFLNYRFRQEVKTGFKRLKLWKKHN